MDNGDQGSQSQQTGSASVPGESIAEKPTVVVLSSEVSVKESVWKRLRKQPRESAAIVVLIVTAILWLDSGESKTQKNTKSSNLMDDFDSYLSEMEPGDSAAPSKESADPVDSPSSRQFENELFIPQPSSGSASAVTANYGDAPSEPSNSAAEYRSSAMTTSQSPANTNSYDSAAFRSGTGNAANNGELQNSQQNRRVRFAGRIKPAN